MTGCTYDVLREAGLVSQLTCKGCEEIISPSVTPWPGEGYVTHPNGRCESAALEKSTT